MLNIMMLNTMMLNAAVRTYSKSLNSFDKDKITVSPDGLTALGREKLQRRNKRILNGTREVTIRDKIFRPYHGYDWFMEKVGFLGPGSVMCMALNAAEKNGYVEKGYYNEGVFFKVAKGCSYKDVFAFLKQKIIASKVFERTQDSYFVEN